LNVKNRAVKDKQQPSQDKSNNSLKKTLDASKAGNMFSNNPTPITQGPFGSSSNVTTGGSMNNPPLNKNVTNTPTNNPISKVETKKGAFGQLPTPGGNKIVSNTEDNTTNKTVGPPIKAFYTNKTTNDFPTQQEEKDNRPIMRNQPLGQTTVSRPPIMSNIASQKASSTGGSNPQPQPFESNKQQTERKQGSPYTTGKTTQQQQQPQQVEEVQTVSLSKEEQYVMDGFEGLLKKYCGIETSQKKQEELSGKMEYLNNKLKKHEINNNLLRLLKDFIDNYENSNTQQLKKYQLAIQGVGWDQNKIWMSGLDRFIQLKGNK